MRIPDGYIHEKTLRSAGASEVVLASSASDRSTVLLKAYGRDDSSRLENELAALRACAGPGVPRALEIIHQEQSVLVLEYVPGLSLDAWISDGLPDMKSVLEVALQIVEVLVRVHEARLVHRDVTPHNVIVEPTSLRVHLIDFGLARPLGAQSRAPAGPSAPPTQDRTIGALTYASPEQTGRMNRGIDARSDLYSLGASLYFAATGRPPFVDRDVLALLHAHLARVPEPACAIHPGVPEPVSHMLAKLLQKEPSDRYQSASALRADLSACYEELIANGTIASTFRLGGVECPDRPHFGSAIYGRDAEIARLRRRFVEAARGAPQLVMIAGEPGMGKSALVDQLRSDVAERGGYLSIGKFDSERDAPYSGWCRALGDLVHHWLVESDARLEMWRTALAAGLGNLAPAIVELIPDLRFLMGDLPPAPALGPRETRARLGLALQRLLAVCATPAHPLVLFLDDLQWSDDASRTLIEELTCSSEAPALLLVGAYRSRDLANDHPLVPWLARLEGRPGGVETITLGPLGIEASEAMLAEALGHSVDQVRDLASQIARKTGNAPLLVREFVEHLHGLAILRFVPQDGWSWDSDAIAEVQVPEGAVALLSARLDRLGAKARSVVSLASCVGDEFHSNLLSELSGREAAELEYALYELVDAGIVAPCARGFRFVHDRLREAAQHLLDGDQRATLHCNMARLMRTRLSDREQDERLLEMADHERRGIERLSAQERGQALDLQLRAGLRALASGAAATAETYLCAARGLVQPEDWDTRHDHVVRLHLASAEAAFLTGEGEVGLRYVDELEGRSLSTLELASAAAQRIQILALAKDPEEVAAYTIEVLRRFGVSWSLHPSRLHTMLHLLGLRFELRLRGVDAIFEPAEEPDPQRLAILLVLAKGAVILNRTDARLVPLVASWVTRQNLRRGCLSRPAYSLAALAVQLFLHLGNTGWADRLHTIALEKSRSDDDPVFGPRTEFQAAVALRPWQVHRRTALAPIGAIVEAMREVGDIENAYYADFLRLAFSALAGDPVQRIEASFREQIERVERAGHTYLEPRCCHQAYALLAASDAQSIGFEQRIAEAEETMARGKIAAETFATSVWLMVLCIYGRFELAFARSEAFFPRLFSALIHIHAADHVFFRGLAAADLASHADRGIRSRYWRALRQSLRSLAMWKRRRGSPDFAHMTALLQAERLRLRKRLDPARKGYELAVRGAEQQGYPHHAALAAERCGVMLLQSRRETLGQIWLSDAARRYREWGCEAKARTLELPAEHPFESSVGGGV